MAMDPEKLDRTWLCTVLFMDIVSYSMNSDQMQAKLKDRFNRYVAEAVRDVAENDRLMLDTGDGAAICFLGDPEAAMFTALKLRASFVRDQSESDPGLKVRIGINLGPVKLIRDINGNLNAIGDGMNTGQRVMSFAGENQVLVSRSFVEVVSCLADDYPQMFHYEGARKDKHVREHIVYQLVPPGQQGSAANTSKHETEHEGATVSAAPPTPPGREALVELPGVANFDQEMLASLGALLAKSVGPLAGHLVKRSAQKAHDASELIRDLAASISQQGDREKFLAQAGMIAHVAADSAAQPPPAVKEATPSWDAAWLEKVRKELAAHVGPMARLLVDRAAKQAASRKDLCEALSAELPAGQRKRFLTALGIG
jgi:class 3 adenylate cyclase